MHYLEERAPLQRNCLQIWESRELYDGPIVDVHAHLFPDEDSAKRFVGTWSLDTIRSWSLDTFNWEDFLPNAARKYMEVSNVEKFNILLLRQTGREFFDATKDLFDPAKQVRTKEIELQAETIRQELSSRIIEFNQWGVDFLKSEPAFECFIGLNPVLMDPLVLMSELERRVDQGATGVKLVAADYEARLDDPRHFAIYDFCQARGIPILHGPPRSSSYRPASWPIWGHPLELAEVYRQFPRIKTIFAHLGVRPNAADTYLYPELIADLAKRYPGVRGDLSGVTRMLANGTMTGEELVVRIRSIGVDRIVFGTNFACGNASEFIRAAEAFRRLPLTAREFQLIGKENYERLFGS